MRSYLQRLVRCAPGPELAAPVRPAVRSASPIVEQDQRLALDGFAEAAADAASPPSTHATPLRAEPAALPQPPPSAAADASRPAPVVRRRAGGASVPAPAMSPSALASAPPPTLPAPAMRPPPAAQPAALVAEPEPPAAGVVPPVPATAFAADPTLAPPRPTTDATPMPALSAPPWAHEPVHHAAPDPDDLRVASSPTSEPAAAIPVPVAVATTLEPAAALLAVETHSVVAPVPRPPETESRIATEPRRAPDAAGRTIVVRETVRLVERSPEAPKAPPMPTLPRTAEEASVIGPLPRLDRERARLELWLR